MNTYEHMMRYQARATGKLMPVGMNYLSDLVVRPGIQKKLWPLLLYKGSMYPGHAHRLWNYSLLMMAAEAETLSDGLKLFGNEAFSQLCGPYRRPQKFTLRNFFTRLHDAPDVTDNIPGFTEYVKMMGLGPCRLTPVDLETTRANCASWRISLHANPGQEPKEKSIKQLFYPFAVYNTQKPDDGKDLVLAVNKVVPRGLPEDLRADICQDMVMAVLEGKIKKENLKDHMLAYMRKGFKDVEWAGWLGDGKTTIAASSPMGYGDDRTFGRAHGIY
jgi:hypothetical protein